MSADKRKALARRVGLLALMAQGAYRRSQNPYAHHQRASLGLHCEGGFAHADPDIQRLLADGHVRFLRYTYGAGWALDLSHPAPLRRSSVVMTPKGRAFLAEHAHLVRKRDPRPTFGVDSGVKGENNRWRRDPLEPGSNPYVPYRIDTDREVGFADFSKGGAA